MAETNEHEGSVNSRQSGKGQRRPGNRGGGRNSSNNNRNNGGGNSNVAGPEAATQDHSDVSVDSRTQQSQNQRKKSAQRANNTSGNGGGQGRYQNGPNRQQQNGNFSGAGYVPHHVGQQRRDHSSSADSADNQFNGGAPTVSYAAIMSSGDAAGGPSVAQPKRGGFQQHQQHQQQYQHQHQGQQRQQYPRHHHHNHQHRNQNQQQQHNRQSGQHQHQHQHQQQHYRNNRPMAAVPHGEAQVGMAQGGYFRQGIEAGYAPVGYVQQHPQFAQYAQYPPEGYISRQGLAYGVGAGAANGAYVAAGAGAGPIGDPGAAFVIDLTSEDDDLTARTNYQTYKIQHLTYRQMDPQLEYHLQYVYYVHGLLLTTHAQKVASVNETARRRATEEWLKTRSEAERRIYLARSTGAGGARRLVVEPTVVAAPEPPPPVDSAAAAMAPNALPPPPQATEVCDGAPPLPTTSMDQAGTLVQQSQSQIRSQKNS